MIDESSKIVFQYTPPEWSDDTFQARGGFVAVVLNYNKKGLIVDSSRSALSQDFPCYEVIMMDDCSKDGSEQEMLAVAKEFANSGKCRVKITVVFNSVNHTIIGQWENAVSISTGTWFGMFCGDDVSLPNRIANARRISRLYPDCWSITTNIATKESSTFCARDGILVWKGSELKRPRDNVFGCSCFWHRHVLEVLPDRCNLDDFLLFWTVIVRRFGDSHPAIVWDTDTSTVQYSLGTGITTELMNNSRMAGNWWTKTWLECVAWRKSASRFGSNVWKIVQDYNLKYGHSRDCTSQILGFVRRAQIVEYNWVGRWLVLLRVFILERNKDYAGYRNEVRKNVLRDFLRLILGPVSYCVYAYMVKRRVSS